MKKTVARGLAFQFLLLGALAATRLYNYLLFHTLAELYSVVIAFTFFIISWQTRRLNEHPPIASLGIAYVFVGILDLFHTLSYAGMNIFVGYSYPANQLWVLARVLEASCLLGFSFLELRSRRAFSAFLGVLGAYTMAGLASVLVFRNFPACYIAGQGQTSFKVAMEAVIIGILVAAGLVLVLRRRLFPARLCRNILLSIGFTILSELPFALYLSNYDWLNLLGHLLKIVSFYLIYRSVLVTGLERPQELLFTRLQAREAELSRVNENQNSILSLVAHDLKGPLGAVASLAQGLADSPGGGDGTDDRDIRQALATASRNSLDLVESILAWAKSQREDFRPVLDDLDLEEVCRDQARLLEGLRSAKGQALAMAFPPGARGRGDREMLGAVVRNLLHNAIKFSPPASALELGAEPRGKDWAIYVRDHGIGIGPEDLSRLFRFSGRSGSPGTAGEKGAGIGLEMAKRLVEVMGGRIEVKSRLGEGSEFTVLLPRTSP